MTQVISYLFDEYDQARDAVRALEDAGFSTADISLVASNAEDRTSEVTDDDDSSEGAATGATIGGVAGAGAGLLASLGVLAIPGLGPLVAAGVLATTLTTAAGGALAGGLVGSLVDYGMSEDEAHLYAEGVRRGGTLVTVRADEERAARARSILETYDPVDAGERRRQYTGSGWKGYDPAAPAYTPDEVARERDRHRV